MLDPGTTFTSPGGSFAYVIQGAVCRLFDREELPWPCCRLSWRGPEPSWRRVGRRLVPDVSSRRHPSYAVTGVDRDGNTWTEVKTDYTYLLRRRVREWWYARTPAPGHDYPGYPED